MYEGTAARRLDAYEAVYASRAVQSSLGVVEGAGLDARARAGVSAQFIATLKMAAFVAITLVVLSFVRVGIYAATTGILIENNTMRTALKDATATRDELRIERSVLSSSTRIERIATQSFGMVMAENTEAMHIGGAAEAAEAAAAEQAAAEAAAAEQAAAEQARAEAEQPADQIEADQSSVEQSAEVEVVQADAEAEAQSPQDVMAEANTVQGDGSTAGANAVDVDSL